MDDESLKNWQVIRDTDVDLWEHFDNLNMRPWPDVWREGLRVFGVMFGGDDGDDVIEEGSAIASVMSAVAVSASNGVFGAFSAALGVSVDQLKFALHQWYELDDRKADAVGFDGLKELCDSAPDDY